MFIDLIRNRRSIRRFLKRPVEVEKMEVLFEAALRAPSSRGLNPWEFIVVTDRDLLEKLSRTKQQGSAFLGDAPLGIVVCADPDTCDIWVEDASVAAIVIQLAAESLGLGSCWIQIRERMHDGSKSAEGYVVDVLSIPARLKVESIIAIGYPDEQKSPHGKDELLYEKVHNQIYGRPFFTAIV
jgi:nitroreductase